MLINFTGNFTYGILLMEEEKLEDNIQTFCHESIDSFYFKWLNTLLIKTTDQCDKEIPSNSTNILLLT